MSFSSQAGLASFTRTDRPHWTEETLTVELATASFELRLSRDGHWYVIHAQGSPNAQSLVGQGFEPGRNPWEWEAGFAARIQKALNGHTA